MQPRFVQKKKIKEKKEKTEKKKKFNLPLNQVDVRISNEKYLRDHAVEINNLIGTLIGQAVVLKPKNVIDFAVDFFCQENLEEVVRNPAANSKQLRAKLRKSGPPRIIICGAPASGKGTQCEIICLQFGVVHISTGDLLRDAVKAGTEIGKRVQAIMEAGNLVDDAIMIRLVLDKMKSDPDCATKGWLLDGFPRTLAQAQAMTKCGILADLVIMLDVTDEIVVERISGRRVDPITHKVYHVKYNPPPPPRGEGEEETEENSIAARLIQRSDDTEEKVKRRLRSFHENIDQVLDFYAQQESDMLFRVNGMTDKYEIAEQITEKILATKSREIAFNKF